MATTIIGTFDDKAVQKVMAELRDAGFKSGTVEVLEGSQDELIAEITGRGFDKADARSYAEAVSHGKKLVAASGSDQEADRAATIMERYEASGEESEEQGGRSTQSVHEVEEELSIAKRQVGRGGVRVTTNVSERPVEQTVTLREEKVEAKRRSADRELSPEEAEEAFEEKTVELTATGEEVEVRKEARVTGEVALSKKISEREQTVKDTVRRSEVEVEEIEPKSRKR
jgi:stress response protein YsnF